MLVQTEILRERHPEDGPSDEFRVLAAVTEAADHLVVELRGAWRLTESADATPLPLHVLDSSLRTRLEDAALDEFRAVKARGESVLEDAQELANQLELHLEMGIESGNIDKVEQYLREVRRVVLALAWEMRKEPKPDQRAVVR